MDELVVYFTPVGEPRTGLWCEVCLLPSAVLQRMEISHDPEVSTQKGSALAAYCDEHDGNPWPEDDLTGVSRWMDAHQIEEV